MSALSLRLPDDFCARLNEDARLAGKSRSEIARQAIAEFLERQEKGTLDGADGCCRPALAADPNARRAALVMANDLADKRLEASVAAEIAADIEPNEKWWR